MIRIAVIVWLLLWSAESQRVMLSSRIPNRAYFSAARTACRSIFLRPGTQQLSSPHAFGPTGNSFDESSRFFSISGSIICAVV